MIFKGVVPSKYEFLKMMKNFTYPLHYDPGKACEESDIAAYPNIGTYRGGILTQNGYYLAHIAAVKGVYSLSDGVTCFLFDGVKK